MELLLDFIIVMGIVVFSVAAGKKKNQNTGKGPVPNVPRETRQHSAASPGGRARHAASEWKKSIYEADRDSHYDRGSLDYCDSDVPSSGGITFRNLPEGTDELAYLARFNRNREKLLEQSLESKG